MWIGNFVENQARRFYHARNAIAAGGTAGAIAIYMIPGILHGFGQSARGLHVLRFALPVLIWAWCIFFLCVWFHPKRGLFSSPDRIQDESFAKEVSILRPIFLGILFLTFCSPFALWALLLF